jgi:hypothetical protein
MPFTPEQMQGVGRILSEKIKESCPSCGESNRRSLVPELYVLSSYVRPSLATFFGDMYPPVTLGPPLKPRPQSGTIGEAMMGHVPQQPAPPSSAPCVMTVCTNCGFTELYNIHVLALAQLLNVPAPGTPLK